MAHDLGERTWKDVVQDYTPGYGFYRLANRTDGVSPLGTYDTWQAIYHSIISPGILLAASLSMYVVLVENL